MSIEKKDAKILLMGLDNAGKTSILLSLQKETNLMSYYNLNPTKGVNYVNLESVDRKINAWDCGGQEKYRLEHLSQLNSYLKDADKLIYVIDIQDVDRYDLTLEYLIKTLKVVELHKGSLEISIFFHKFDPDLRQRNPSLIKEDIPRLNKKISEIFPKILSYQIFETTIFTIFQKNLRK